MKKIYRFIEKFGTKKNIIFGLSFIVLCNLVLFPLFLKLFFVDTISINDILDIKFMYSNEVVLGVLNNFEADGRGSYLLLEIFLDIPYAIIYGFTYVSILYILLNFNNFMLYRKLILVPLLISLFDIFENIGIITMISSFPNISDTIVKVSSYCTSLKWTFAILTFLLISFNSLVYAFRKIKNIN